MILFSNFRLNVTLSLSCFFVFKKFKSILVREISYRLPIFLVLVKKKWRCVSVL
ncbi:osmoprotectant, partial [Listeria monocytogenes]|nr:osmoprotectant [Listeria monocytogenes]